MTTIWYINPTSFKVDENKKKVTISGHPELTGHLCIYWGEDMVMLRNNGDGYEMCVANMKTGKVRKFVDKNGNVLIDMSDIDMETIRQECCNGFDNAHRRLTRYGVMNSWDGFKNGLCALSWTLYPDGLYFADEDGFGAECCCEETVYAIINKELEIVKPFTYVNDERKYLSEVRSGK